MSRCCGSFPLIFFCIALTGTLVCHLERSWGIHIWNTKLSSCIEQMQTTRTIYLVHSLPLVPFLLGVTELELSQHPSGQLQQILHFRLLLWRHLSEKGWWKSGSSIALVVATSWELPRNYKTIVGSIHNHMVGGTLWAIKPHYTLNLQPSWQMFVSSALADCQGWGLLAVPKQQPMACAVQCTDKGFGFTALDCMVHGQEIKSDRREMGLTSSPPWHWNDIMTREAGKFGLAALCFSRQELVKCFYTLCWCKEPCELGKLVKNIQLRFVPWGKNPSFYIFTSFLSHLLPPKGEWK